MKTAKCIEYAGPSGVEILTLDHMDTGCPVYASFERDLFVKEYPDGTLREIVPLDHHMMGRDMH